MLWQRKRYPYDVTLHLHGRHPYIESTHLDYPTRDIVVRVNARNWNDAAKIALRSKPSGESAWAWWVLAVARVSA